MVMLMNLNSATIKKIMLLIVFAAIIFWLGQYINLVFQILFNILKILTPLILGFAIAFILNVFMKVIESFWDRIFRNAGKINKKLKRPLSLLITFLIIGIFLFILLFMIVPEISNSIAKIVKMLPTYMDHLEANITTFMKNSGLTFVNFPDLEIDWGRITTTIGNFLSEGGKSFFNTTLDVTSSIFSVFVNLILGIVFSIYMLLQKEKLNNQFKRVMNAFLPSEIIKHVLNVGIIANHVFTRFVKGQFLEAVIIGILCFIGMSILRLPYAVMISALVGFTALIPIVGAFIGTAIGALLILLVNPIQALWFIIFIIVLQQLEGNLIYPRVVGKSIGLPGIWVLAAVTIGGSIGGILGMLLSVPICSIVYTLFRNEVIYRIKKKNGDKLKDNF